MAELSFPQTPPPVPLSTRRRAGPPLSGFAAGVLIAALAIAFLPI